jgi:hypothetical protein
MLKMTNKHTKKMDEVFKDEHEKKSEEIDKQRKHVIIDSETLKHVHKKKHIPYKWLYLVPIIILLYLGYANFIQNHTFNHFYDIGSGQDAKTPYLTPNDRVSSIDNNETRNFTSHPLTYFKVDIPKGFKKIDVQLKLEDTFNNNTIIYLGYQNDSIWSYKNTLIYDENQEVFSEYEKSSYESYDMYKLTNKSFNDSRIQSDVRIPIDYEINNFKDKSTINVGLRGGHSFYVYLNNSLNLSIIKQDINWYNGSDILKIELYDLNGTLIANTSIDDDGFNDAKKNTSIQQTGTLQVDNVQGVYELRFSDFDGIIRRIDINTNKIITNKLFLADNNLYIPNSTKNTTTYFKSGGYSKLKFLTYHGEGFQVLKLNTENTSINKTHFDYKYNTFKGSKNITTTNNDIIISISNGYLSFSEDGFFEPFLPVEPVDINNLDDIDYVILPKSNYTKVQRDGDWIIAETSFNLEDAYINNNQLSMMITIPHLSKFPNASIPIDYINITVYKYGILQR